MSLSVIDTRSIGVPTINN